MRLFGTSGIRRIADRDLLELALKVGLAVGNVYQSVVIGGDTRTSSDAVKHAFASGVMAAGSECYDAGVVPTPTLALAARDFQVGAMITASHNPPEYNGIKLLNPDGAAFNTEQQTQIEEMVFKDNLSTVLWGEIKNIHSCNGTVEQHIECIMKNLTVESKPRVVLDCDGAAASVITPGLLERLGCEVVAMNCEPSGFFPHAIEPIEDNLGELIRSTKETGADLGIAHDGDADRMMAVDDRGRVIAGDKLLVLFARQMRAKEIVTTVDASMAVDEMGFSVTRTRVGDIHVSEELKRGGDFGGEPSGSWVFPEISLCPDGICAAARLVEIAGREKISQVVDEIPGYPLLRGSVAGGEVSLSALESGLTILEPISVNNVDGIKLEFEDGWLLVRVSGTEPKVRVTAEARNEERVRQLYESGIRIIRECLQENREKQIR